MFKFLKKKITSLASYVLGLDEVYKKLDERLAQAKNDKERITILEEALEATKEAFPKLASENIELKERVANLEGENAKLRERIKENEELDSILSSGSSVSSSEGIDTKIDQNIKDLEGLLLNTKKSTAPIRREIKLLKRVKKLKFLNHQKDLKIKELEKQGDLSISLKEVNQQAEEVIQKSQILIENIKNL